MGKDGKRDEVAEISAKFREMLTSGRVQGRIVGPKDNVLECRTQADFLVAGGELHVLGYHVTSPGGADFEKPISRTAIWNRMWRDGTLCATVIRKNVFIFTIPTPFMRDIHDMVDVVKIKRKK